MKRRTFLIKSATVLAGASFAPATVVVGNGCRAAPSIKGRQRSPATEPLRVHPTNPRYFTDGSGRAIYLTGSHTWTNLQEGDASKPPFDFDAYLDFLVQHNHNFVRLWSWQSTDAWIFPAITPHPWERTGPGKAQDGKPKFDLTKFHQPYFNRLRSRVMAARDRSIYVGVMLFVGGTSPSPTNGDGIPSTATTT